MGMGKKEGWWEAGGWWIRWRGRRNWKETERRKMRAKDLFEAHFPQSDLEFLFSNWNDVQQTFCFNSNVSFNPSVGNISCCCMLSSVESPRHDFQPGCTLSHELLWRITISHSTCLSLYNTTILLIFSDKLTSTAAETFVILSKLTILMLWAYKKNYTND